MRYFGGKTMREQSPFHAYLGGWNAELTSALIESLKTFRDQHAKLFMFYSCFISYSTMDHEFAERLHADLQRNAYCAGLLHTMLKQGRNFTNRSKVRFILTTDCF
jgi:hypothetical protein